LTKRTLWISQLAKRGYKSIAFYQHQSVLRLTLEGLGVTKLPGEAATAPAMWSFSLRPRAAPHLVSKIHPH